MSAITEVEPNVFAAGQPTADQIARLAQMGFVRVIDLRPAAEDHGSDEPAILAAAGMEYLSLPIAAEADLASAAVNQLDQWLGDASIGKTLIHCASGNRVGALLALRAAWHQNFGTEQALQLGRVAGLKSLEPAVCRLLQEGRS